MKSLLFFVLGLIVGAGLLFAVERAPEFKDLFLSPEQMMQASLVGLWQGKVTVQGTDVDFSLAVKREGKTETGVISAAQIGDIPCDSVAVDSAGNVTFSAHAADKGATFTGKLTPEAHTMAGNMTGSVGDGSWSLAKK